MRKVLLIIVIAILAVMAALTMTKPDRTAHYEAVKRVVFKVVETEVTRKIPDESLMTIGIVTALNATDEYLQKNMLVYEHTFYNIGFILYDNRFLPVSIGVMGQVHLTFDQKDLERLTKHFNVIPPSPAGHQLPSRY